MAINTSIREALQAPIFKRFDDVSESALWSIISIRLLLSRRALKVTCIMIVMITNTKTVKGHSNCFQLHKVDII